MGIQRENRVTKNARFIVRSASILSPLNSSRDLANQMERVPIRDLAEAAIVEKVSSRMLKFLDSHKSDLAKELMKDPIFAEHITRIKTVADKTPMLVHMLEETGCKLGIPILAIKGLSVKEYYADPQLRDMNDIDIMVWRVDDALQLMPILHDLGYMFECRELPWLKRDLATGNVYGQFNLKFSQIDTLPSIDIHFGGYSVRHCGLCRLKKAQPKPGLSYLSLQENLPYLVGNAAGDYRITTKDLNDISLSLNIHSKGWRQAIAELDIVGLLPFFNLMLYNLKQFSNLSNLQSLRIEGILKRSNPEWPQPSSFLSWQRRWLATSKHAFRLGLRHSYRQAIISAFSAMRYYWKPLQKVVVKRRQDSVTRMPELNSLTCIRLVPVELLGRILSDSDDEPIGISCVKVTGPTRQISSRMSIIQSSYGDVVRSPIGDFFPMVFYELDRQLLDLANTC